MTIDEIIEADVLKNHEGVTVEEAKSKFNEYVDKGFEVKKIGDTVFLYKAGKTKVYYHSVNAAPMKQYVDNLEKFFKGLKGYTVAGTKLTNPKLEGLAKRYMRGIITIKDGYAIADLRGI